MFSHADVTPPWRPPYWITANGLYAFLPCKLVKFSKKLTIKSPEWNFSLGVWLFAWNNTEEYNAKTPETMPNIAILTWERLINPEICTPKKEITLAKLKGKQLRGNTLKHITLKYYKNNALNLSSNAYKAKTICVFNVTCWKKNWGC